MTAIRSVALLVARLILGFVFIMHGWQKLHTNGISNVEKGFSAMGIPAPGLAAQYATWVELIGGIALVLGLLLPLVGILLSADMLGAMAYAHWDAGFWASDGGYELVLSLVAASLAIGFAKPGFAALDNYLFRWQRQD
ncbi:DoxX family protein [Gordonia sp. TBRC 11910]|uniref:DoxX family protein n=1 Tax=Gordonia asplenii TaxID=2725283 RepID=A0A848L7E0_9ACTN|nr:DoxX family protein [Gordonia asplenii]NMO04915.1 DoxX family protein [Gordonia asplenii]